MRFSSCSLGALLLVVLAVGCSTVSPDECWPNTSGGLGGSGPIPIGAGVGATSSGGDFDTPSGGTANPCVTPSNPDEGAEALDTWITCKGLDVVDCMMKCAEAGAACTPRRKHPNKPEAGPGDLYRCKNGYPTHTCSYLYSNGDECIFFAPFGMIPWCVYVGGKP
jgi:hypothetical protein